MKDVLSPWREKLHGMLGKYKYIFLVMLVGVILLLLPSFGGEKKGFSEQTEIEKSAFDVADTERKLEVALSRIEGAGRVTVVLTVKNGVRKILAQDGRTNQKEGATDEEQTTVVVSRGSGIQETVSLQSVAPTYRGALVVCSGGDDPSIRLKLVEAVSALTGLGSDKISVCKGSVNK